jgi:hypothetical protein
MEYDISNLTMDSNYLSIEEYLDFPIEEVVKKALETLNSVEEYDDIPSISNNKGWEDMAGKRGIDTKPRMTLERLMAE